ncbi:MAG TPA: SLBB domain-containing protein [Thermodesulfobacteriota bacterium]|nr:SLBB domain-containing protein [Thermodesulfobacteriota bacterium]
MPQARKDVNPETQELNRKLIQESFSSDVAVDYLIGPGDLLSIQVLEAPELSTEARVNTQNTISFPLLGKVDIGGLTAQEAEERIKEQLSEKYMHDPHVVVAIKEFKSQRVAVIGSVKNPGTYELLGKGNLLDALALAGGLADDASEIAYITRKGKQGQDKTVQVDLNQLLDEGKSDLNVSINMGDVVYIPEAGVVYVDGAVNKPGTFRIEDEMTVSQAVTAAGGVSRVAEESDVSLIRNKKGQIEVTAINLEEIKEGQTPDIVLEDQDVVVVGKNAIRSFFDTIRLGLFFPPFSVGVQ